MQGQKNLLLIHLFFQEDSIRWVISKRERRIHKSQELGALTQARGEEKSEEESEQNFWRVVAQPPWSLVHTRSGVQGDSEGTSPENNSKETQRSLDTLAMQKLLFRGCRRLWKDS